MEACPLLSCSKQSCEFTITRMLIKPFHTGCPAVVKEYWFNFNCMPIHEKFVTLTNFCERQKVWWAICHTDKFWQILLHLKKCLAAFIIIILIFYLFYFIFTVLLVYILRVLCHMDPCGPNQKNK